MERGTKRKGRTLSPSVALLQMLRANDGRWLLDRERETQLAPTPKPRESPRLSVLLAALPGEYSLPLSGRRDGGEETKMSDSLTGDVAG